jgi:hypothetical protein
VEWKAGIYTATKRIVQERKCRNQKMDFVTGRGFVWVI